MGNNSSLSRNSRSTEVAELLERIDVAYLEYKAKIIEIGVSAEVNHEDPPTGSQQKIKTLQFSDTPPSNGLPVPAEPEKSSPLPLSSISAALPPSPPRPPSIPAVKDKKYHVFLSHAWGKDGLNRDNHERVKELNQYLKAKGLSTWFDEDRLRSEIRSELTEGIESSVCFIAVITDSYRKKVNDNDNRDNCRFEFTFGVKKIKAENIITVVHEPSMLQTDTWGGLLEAEVGGILYVDMSSERRDRYIEKCEELFRRIHSIVLKNNSRVKLPEFISAEEGNTWAMECLAYWYESKESLRRVIEDTVSFYKEQATAGEDEGIYNLGWCYEFGIGVTKDLEKAIETYRQLTEIEHIGAMFRLGRCYDIGIGVEQNYEEAIRLYKTAAQKGYASALRNLGVCYENGEGVTKDLTEAVRLYRLAADKGDSTALYNLGLCYKNGQGVTKDLTEAVRLYRLAADKGNSNALHSLGLCYKNGEGVTKDMTEAVRLYRLAADKGNSFAFYSLGVCYKNGEGVTKDMTEAVRLYRLAADKGHSAALNNLGNCYKNGWGVTKDLTEAVRLYRLAADKGHSAALNNLGNCYENGQGVTKDLTEAVRLYRLAADKGDSDALTQLKALEKK